MNNILDYADVIDCLHNTPKYSKTGFPIVRVEDVKNAFLNNNECLRVNESICDYQNKKYIPKKGDIIITRVGSYGMVAYLNTNDKICLGQNVAIISPKKYGKFLYYYLQSPYIQKFIHGNSGGSSYKSLSLEMIKKLPVNIDNINPNKVGDMLFTLDEKIDNNKKIIKTISEMLTRTYEEWFLKFEFPIGNNKTFKSSGGKMVFNEILNKGIPFDWDIEQLSDIVKKVNNSISKKDVGNKFYTPIDCIDGHNISYTRIAPSSDANSSLISYNKKNIIFGSMRCYFHRVAIAPFDGITRTTAFVFEPINKDNLPYIYQTINLDSTVKYAVSTSKGTQQPYAVWENVLENYYIVKPPQKYKDEFSKAFEKSIDEVLILTNENRNLENLKQKLIFHLMNGQVKINE